MPAIQIIPAIDLIDGKCVRLQQGDYNKKTEYSSDPLEVAQKFQDHGVSKLHLVDLDGAKSGRIINYKVLESLASKTNLDIDFGGGLKSDEDLHIAFDSGAKQITGGSIAVKNPEVFESWITSYGSNKIILGADAKDEKIAVTGWLESTDEYIYDFIQGYQEKGIKYCISTDISKDGMLLGPSKELYAKMQSENKDLHIIASGGIRNLDDIKELDEMNLYGVIFGKAFYEGHITLKELEAYIVS